MKKIVACVIFAWAMAGIGADRSIAVFVQNRTQTPGMDVACGAVRERFVSALAEVPGFRIVDSTLATDAFNASPNVARQLGVDYVAVIGIVGASSMQRPVNGRVSTVYTLRMTLKITDSAGTALAGTPTWVRQLPVLEASGDAAGYYDLLFDQWEREVVAAVAQQAPNWRSPALVEVQPVPFWISTTVDRPIQALESQTKGVKGERLAELRRIAGGATVEIDGTAVGTAPCTLAITPGLHKLRITRQWMDDYETTVSVVSNGVLEVAMELSEAGVAKWGSMEKVQADAAERYGNAARERGVKINIDTAHWRDGAVGGNGRTVKFTD